MNGSQATVEAIAGDINGTRGVSRSLSLSFLLVGLTSRSHGSFFLLIGIHHMMIQTTVHVNWHTFSKAVKPCVFF